MPFPGMEGGFPPFNLPPRGGSSQGQDDSWPPFPPVNPLGFGPSDAAAQDGDAAHGKAETPKLPCASPVGDIVCPIGEALDPYLTTPAWGSAGSADFPPWPGPGDNNIGKLEIGGLSQMDTWAWEMGSDAGSIPSAWSKATSSRTGQSGTSRLSSATGHDGLIPGLVEGQRLSSVKPTNVSSVRGGKVIVNLRKEVPQGYWDTLSVVLVNLPVSLTLKPTGIKKGKKLCVEVPPGMKPDDYDVRLKFGEKIIHGSIPLSIRDDDEDGDVGMDDDDDMDLASQFRSLKS